MPTLLRFMHISCYSHFTHVHHDFYLTCSSMVTYVMHQVLFPLNLPKIPQDYCMNWVLSSFHLTLFTWQCNCPLLIIILDLTALFMGVNNCTQQGCLIGAQPVFIVVYLLRWCDAVILSVYLTQRVNPGTREQTRKAPASSACTPSNRSLIGWEKPNLHTRANIRAKGRYRNTFLQICYGNKKMATSHSDVCGSLLPPGVCYSNNIRGLNFSKVVTGWVDDEVMQEVQMAGNENSVVFWFVLFCFFKHVMFTFV